VTAIQPEADGTVLLATVGTGVWRVQPDLRAEQVYATTDVMADLLRDRTGTLWMASGTGVVRLDAGVATRVPGLATPVEVLLEAADGAIWAGGRAGLRRMGPNGITSVDGLTGAKVRALFEDGRGSLWIGTYDGGLIRLRDGKLSRIRKRDGLFEDGVFAILDDGAGRLWMSSNRGIHSVSLADLDAFADGRAASVSSRFLSRAEGMLSSECNGGMQPAGFRRADGTLVFPTQKGLVVVDPRAFRLNEIAPEVVIEGVASERRTLRPGPEVVLEPRESQLEVAFTAPTFLRAPQARFRYFMEGLDDHWVEAGGARSARYAHLPPGRFRFRVTACNGDGVWNAQGTSFAVVVSPAWWETTWLRLGAALAFFGVVGVGIRNRFARLARRRAEQDLFARRLIESQESERKRIAGELHDGVGQALVMIRNRGLMSLREDADAARVRRQAEQIVDAAGSGLDEIHKVIHNLRPYQLDRLGLTRAVEGIVEEAAEASGIVVDAIIDPMDGVFSTEDDIHVYRIVQEAVSNVVRHAGASKVRVRVQVAPQEVMLAVEDDGHGFDPATLPPEKRGMGLSGIAERVRILGGRQTVESAPGRGTKLSVRLPRREAAG
jgi:signal transduction histidine kinase